MQAADGFPEFDHYEISRVLGEGGMGIVYLARDRRTDLPVAIKLMSKRIQDPESQFRFVRENQILSALNHRNIVRCYEITQSHSGVPSIVMEYVDGVDLRAFEGRPFQELLPLMIQAAMGMEYLRRQNIVHRDLSSNNILVVLESEKRLVKILDFGIAKILHENPVDGDVHTQTGQFLGKFAFASPELFVSTDVDWRSDVYSLGVVYYRLLTMQPPVKVEKTGNYFEWVMAHQRHHSYDFEPVPGCPEVPEGLKAVVRRMLSRDPLERPQSYSEVIQDLDGVQRAARAAGLEPDPAVVCTLPAPFAGASGSHPSGRSGAASPSGSPPRPVAPARPVVAPVAAGGYDTPGGGRRVFGAEADRSPYRPATDEETYRQERAHLAAAAAGARSPAEPAPLARDVDGASPEFERTARYDEVRELVGARVVPPGGAAAPASSAQAPPRAPAPVPAEPVPSTPAGARAARPTAPRAAPRSADLLVAGPGYPGPKVRADRPVSVPRVTAGPKPRRLLVALIVLAILAFLGAVVAGLVYLLQMASAPGHARLAPPDRAAVAALGPGSAPRAPQTKEPS